MKRTRGSGAKTPTLFDLDPDPDPEPAPEPRKGPRPDSAAEPGLFARVALNRPVRREFTYGVPEGLANLAAEGVRVSVPFGPRGRMIGVVVGIDTTSDVGRGRLRPVLEVLDTEPVVGRELLGLTRWIADRYACAWGEALAAVLPAPLKRRSGSRRVAMLRVRAGVAEPELEQLRERFPKQFRLLRTLLELGEPVERRDILRRLQLSDSPAQTLVKRGWVEVEWRADPPDVLLSPRSGRPRPERLSPAQDAALKRIAATVEGGAHATFLLEGVTGSGKTEVYLNAIEHALARGRSAIVLVPEIALTPQTVGWFRSRFEDVCVLHSRMTDAQRLAMWRKLQRGEARVVVGARSAVFAPLENLGVIVVDEEHEPSFKQESVPRYHARDVAVERARRAGAVCILGSATPSLESWRHAKKEDYVRLSLPERVGGGAPPTVHVIDMRLEQARKGERPLFSRLLGTLLAETLAAKEQTILFLNRRGFIPVLWCPGCETTVRCVQCDMGLTYHRRIDRLVCHACCEERSLPAACPTCSRPGLRFLGVGSERVESVLGTVLPGARVRRMDSDTMRRREDYEEALGAFARHEVDVLVGTQMIAKGLDFPRVTLVGIVSADQALHFADFRAAERTFQLVAQVAGRAGRAELPGRIVVQTVSPEHPAIRLAARNDFEGFARQEDALRAELGYPPHGRLVRAVFEDTDEARVVEGAERCAAGLRTAGLPPTVSILGPAPAPFSLLRGRYRHHLLLKSGADDAALEAAVERLAELSAKHSRPSVKIDVDPMSML